MIRDGVTCQHRASFGGGVGGDGQHTPSSHIRFSIQVSDTPVPGLSQGQGCLSFDQFSELSMCREMMGEERRKDE